MVQSAVVSPCAIDRCDSAAPVVAAIDRDHLAELTLGARGLEIEVLRLFGRQADVLMARMAAVPPAAVPSLAQVLRISARSIGAWEVAQAAETVMLADGVAMEAADALARLARAIERAHAEIAGILRAH